MSSSPEQEPVETREHESEEGARAGDTQRSLVSPLERTLILILLVALGFVFLVLGLLVLVTWQLREF